MRIRPTPPSRPAPAARVLAALGAALLAAGCGGADAPEAGTRTAARTLLALATPQRPFEVVRERPDAPVELARLTPAIAASTDGLDLLALRVAPPAALQFQVPASDARLRLVGRFGAHRTVGAERPARLGVLVAVDERSAWEREFAFDAGSPPTVRRWHWIGDSPEGVSVEPGAVVQLRVLKADPDAGPLPVGFADLAIVEDRAVPLQAASPERPNLVLIVADTLRADRLGPYGYARGTTPRLDALAARGLVHERARSSSAWTWPSTASLFTGRLPTEHGLHDRTQGGWLVDSLDTLPEALQRAGYRTAGWSGNPLVSPSANFDEGFERFEAPPAEFTPTREFLGDALAWVRAHRDERFFLYLQPVETHWPYPARPDLLDRWIDPEVRRSLPTDHANPTEELIAAAEDGDGPERAEAVIGEEAMRHLSQRYDACVATLDAHLGELLDALEALGLTDDTLVVVTADHGEELFDRGRLGHGYTVLDEQTHVPLVLAGPGVPAGARSATPVGNRHLAATLAERGGAALQGATPAPGLLTGRDVAAAPVYLETQVGIAGPRRTPTYGVVEGPWLLSWQPDERSAADLGVRLFDLDRDPGARLDLAAGEPERVAALLQNLRRRLEEGAALRPAQGPELGEGVREMLEGAGYLERR